MIIGARTTNLAIMTQINPLGRLGGLGLKGRAQTDFERGTGTLIARSRSDRAKSDPAEALDLILSRTLYCTLLDHKVGRIDRVYRGDLFKC